MRVERVDFIRPEGIKNGYGDRPAAATGRSGKFRDHSDLISASCDPLLNPAENLSDKRLLFEEPERPRGSIEAAHHR